MRQFKEFTVDEMASRVLRNIPELDYKFVVSCLKYNPVYGLDAFSVQKWLQFFDELLIDEREYEECEN